ncbi:unnamed protein product [Onchocerca flexuosa]|uniref:Ovule protein n=1 Tax=Onchocerca flexuosa TaxID=387005 RepID=A0A183HZS6_9BILA|nr:unnamed protein product [Onchocerca flexuosa]
MKGEEEWLVSMKKEKVETEERACPKLFTRYLTSPSSEKEENTIPGNHFSLRFVRQKYRVSNVSIRYHFTICFKPLISPS